MALSTIAVVGGLGALGLLAWAATAEAGESDVEPRELWLTTGTQYALTIHEPNVVNPDDLASMLTSLGFVVQDIQPVFPPGYQPRGLADMPDTFLVTALWNQQNTLWQVPDNVSISAV